MFDHLVVPVDGSDESFAAVRVAARMAEAVAGRVDAVMVVERFEDIEPMRGVIAEGVARLGPLPVEVLPIVHMSDSVAGAIARHLDHSTGGMVVMSAHGHGRSAAVIGSVADAILRETFGPQVVVGPMATTWNGTLDGMYVVPLDGSRHADAMLPIVGAWTVEFGGTPWLVEVLDGTDVDGDVMESSLVSSRARDLRRLTRHDVEFEVLHGDRPARSIVDFATENAASMIAMTTHGRTGFERLRSGSVAASVVHRATCPVLMYRPPELAAGRLVTASASHAD